MRADVEDVAVAELRGQVRQEAVVLVARALQEVLGGRVAAQRLEVDRGHGGQQVEAKSFLRHHLGYSEGRGPRE